MFAGLAFSRENGGQPVNQSSLALRTMETRALSRRFIVSRSALGVAWPRLPGTARANKNAPVARDRRAVPLWAALVVGCLLLAGCRNNPFESASNNRNWNPDQAVLAWAEFQGDDVRVHNVRQCAYLSAEDYVVDYEDRQYRLSELEAVDFIVVPFKESTSLAHTMLSFAFAGDRHLVVSVEIRKERGEHYEPFAGAFNQFEIMYVVGDENDLIKLRTNYRKDDVFVYRMRATPEQTRRLFQDVMDRVNYLREHPEYYNTLWNNCTTNIRRHANRLAPGRVPLDVRVFLPGYADRFAYDLGLIDSSLNFEETRRRALVSERARAAEVADFSRAIRR